MAKTAVLYGVHGNRPALLAVVRDAERAGVERFVSLGDAVGPGPHPVECAEWVRDVCDWHLAGFFDRCLADPALLKGSSAVHANALVDRNRKSLETSADGTSLIDHLSGGGFEHREGRALFVCGSACDPLGYLPDFCPSGDPHAFAGVEPESAALPDDVRVCFAGRLGLPCVIRRSGETRHASAHEGLLQVAECDPPIFVNVGSVGLPKDGDPRSAYAVFDGDTVEFRRVAYDFERTARDLRSAPGEYRQAASFFAERLASGR